MPTIYYLSSRQAKELLIRGRPLRIAVPAPPGPTPDPLDWARSVLDPQLRPMARDARRMIVRAVPYLGGEMCGITEIIGRFAADHERDWSVGVEVVALTLAPTRPREAMARTQWPGHCVHNGVRIPPTD
jgi:hypothetical protein